MAIHSACRTPVLLGLVVLAALVGEGNAGRAAARSPEFHKDGELVFASPTDSVRVKIDVEIADTPVRRTTGLMYRTALKESQGMLFIFPRSDYQSFWMKNTVLSLDILFVNEDMQVVTIYRNTTPLSEESYPSTEAAQYVVEVNAGFVDRHGIRLKDKVYWQTM
jgi:uncharacterized membrane protein (UPF0127 family)